MASKCYGTVTTVGSSNATSFSRTIEKVFDEAQHTGEINLSGRNLSEYPKLCSKYDLTDTICLDLSKNHFTDIPREASDYLSLESLSIHHNLIKTVPDAFFNLTSLTCINLSRNYLCNLPPVICNLRALEVIIVSNNKLVSLPEELGLLNRLTELDVSCNEISHIPVHISDAVSLQILNLRQNRLVEVPSELCKLRLVRLDLSENKIEIIPTTFRKLDTLNDLCLDHNPLTSPPAHICKRGRVHVMKYLSIQSAREDFRKGQRNDAELNHITRKPLNHHTSSVHELNNIIEMNEPSSKRHTVGGDSGYSTTDSNEKCNLSPMEISSEDVNSLAIKAAEMAREQRYAKDCDMTLRRTIQENAGRTIASHVINEQHVVTNIPTLASFYESLPKKQPPVHANGPLLTDANSYISRQSHTYSNMHPHINIPSNSQTICKSNSADSVGSLAQESALAERLHTTTYDTVDGRSTHGLYSAFCKTNPANRSRSLTEGVPVLGSHQHTHNLSQEDLTELQNKIPELHQYPPPLPQAPYKHHLLTSAVNTGNGPLHRNTSLPSMSRASPINRQLRSTSSLDQPITDSNQDRVNSNYEPSSHILRTQSASSNLNSNNSRHSPSNRTFSDSVATSSIVENYKFIASQSSPPPDHRLQVTDFAYIDASPPVKSTTQNKYHVVPNKIASSFYPTCSPIPEHNQLPINQKLHSVFCDNPISETAPERILHDKFSYSSSHGLESGGRQTTFENIQAEKNHLYSCSAENQKYAGTDYAPYRNQVTNHHLDSARTLYPSPDPTVLGHSNDTPYSDPSRNDLIRDQPSLGFIDRNNSYHVNRTHYYSPTTSYYNSAINLPTNYSVLNNHVTNTNTPPTGIYSNALSQREVKHINHGLLSPEARPSDPGINVIRSRSTTPQFYPVQRTPSNSSVTSLSSGHSVRVSDASTMISMELQRQKAEIERQKKQAEAIRLQQDETDKHRHEEEEKDERRRAAIKLQEEQKRLLQEQKQKAKDEEQRLQYERQKAEELVRQEEAKRAEEIRRLQYEAQRALAAEEDNIRQAEERKVEELQRKADLRKEEADRQRQVADSLVKKLSNPIQNGIDSKPTSKATKPTRKATTNPATVTSSRRPSGSSKTSSVVHHHLQNGSLKDLQSPTGSVSSLKSESSRTSAPPRPTGAARKISTDDRRGTGVRRISRSGATTPTSTSQTKIAVAAKVKNSSSSGSLSKADQPNGELNHQVVANHIDEKIKTEPMTLRQRFEEAKGRSKLPSTSSTFNKTNHDTKSSPGSLASGRPKAGSVTSLKTIDSNGTLRRQQQQAVSEADAVNKLRKTIETRLKRSLSDNIEDDLRNGVVLCHLVNQVRPQSITYIHVPSPSVKTLTAAKCRKNVEKFIEACRRIGVSQHRLCSADDILEAHGISRVATTVSALVTLSPKHTAI